MTKAFKHFLRIEKLPTLMEKHREWLREYDGKVYSIAEKGIHKMKWVKEARKYWDDLFSLDINLIKELKNRTRIEFDDKDSGGDKDKEKIVKHIEDVVTRLKENKWGFIRTTHYGASDYLWIEFNRDIKPIEKEAFLKWIAPDNSEVDLNFASDRRVFPVMFAKHWKHGKNEVPVEYFDGEQIDYDSIKKEVISGEDDFEYQTFIKNEPPTEEEFNLLKDPEFFNKITNEFKKKIIGETNTCQAVFLSACATYVKNISNKPHMIVNGESSVGKSYLVGKILGLFPIQTYNQKDCYRTRISSKALTYWHNSQVEPTWTWDGKILYLEDIGEDIINCDVFKVMATEGSKATIVGRGKINGVEIPKTIDIDINGNPLIIVTTAEAIPKNEIINRFSIIDLDESHEQTKSIMKFQLDVAISGKIDEYDEKIRSSLSKLKRVNVLLPHRLKEIIEKMGNNITNVRLRRDFPRIINLIKASASLHQYQREVISVAGMEFILANLNDYNLAKEVYSGKIGNSGGSFGLTHREKNSLIKIKEFCKSNIKCNASDMYAFFPQYTERSWYRILEKLAGKGILNIIQEINEKTNKKNNFFVLSEQFDDFELPDIELIIRKEGIVIDKNDIDVNNDKIDKNDNNSLVRGQRSIPQNTQVDTENNQNNQNNKVECKQSCHSCQSEIFVPLEIEVVPQVTEVKLYSSNDYVAVDDIEFVGGFEHDRGVEYSFKKGDNVNGLDPRYKEILSISGKILKERRNGSGRCLVSHDRRKIK